MKPAIEVNNISKAYIINHKNKASYNTLKDDIGNIIRRPLGRGAESSEEQFWALRDISFDVPKGEIFGVIGKNGSGKSTLLKILSRIVDPTKGSVHIRGRVASLLEVGTGFHPELTGRENVFFNGSMLGMSRQEISRKFNEIVEFSEIEKFIDTPVKFYSSGMYVRLAFAVAAHLDPEILILDEVLAVGDASFQQKSMKKVLSTMEEGKTVLFVSHSMHSVRQLCSKGILLNKGRVEASGDVGKIIDRYMLETMNDGSVDLELHSTWENDGTNKNDMFEIEHASVIDGQNKPVKDEIERGQDYWLRVEGTLKTTDDRFQLGYAVWDKESKDIIYITMSSDGSQKNWPKLKAGKTVFYGRIPKNLFNHGVYRLTVVTALNRKYWIYDPESSPVRLALRVGGELSKSPHWQEPRGGLIAPIIDDWRAE